MNYLISEVQKSGEKIKITFDSDDFIEISKENYLRFDYLYRGKRLTAEQYFDLSNYEKDEKYRQYLRNLLKKGSYSLFQCVKKLTDIKGLDVKSARRLVGNLEREGLIDDHRYLENKIPILQFKNCSPQMIKSYLKYEAGVDDRLIAKFDSQINLIDEDRLRCEIGRIIGQNKDGPLKKRQESALYYLQKKQYPRDFSCNLVETYCRENNIVERISEEYKERIVDKYLCKYQKYKGKKKKDLIFAALIHEGMDFADIREMVENINVEEDDINGDSLRIYDSICHTTGDERKKLSLFYKKMTNLGYTLEAIRNIIEENEYEFGK